MAGLRPRRAAALQAYNVAGGVNTSNTVNTQFPVIQVLLTVKLNCLSSVSTACSRGTPSTSCTNCCIADVFEGATVASIPSTARSL